MERPTHRLVVSETGLPGHPLARGRSLSSSRRAASTRPPRTNRPASCRARYGTREGAFVIAARSASRGTESSSFRWLTIQAGISLSRPVCGLGQQMGGELRLSTRTHHEQHQELGGLEGCGMTEILAQAPASSPCRRSPPPTSRSCRRGRKGDLPHAHTRIALKEVHGPPVCRRAAAVEEPRLGEEESTGTDGGHATEARRDLAHMRSTGGHQAPVRAVAAGHKQCVDVFVLDRGQVKEGARDLDPQTARGRKRAAIARQQLDRIGRFTAWQARLGEDLAGPCDVQDLRVGKCDHCDAPAPIG